LVLPEVALSPPSAVAAGAVDPRAAVSTAQAPVAATSASRTTGNARRFIARDCPHRSRCEAWSREHIPFRRKLAYAVQMAISDKRKQSLYFPEEMLKEIGAEATRQDRSLSWIVQKAWKAARKDIMNIPSVADSPDDQGKDGVAK
jgi:uncharacterized small protein (TIGR04563 family)